MEERTHLELRQLAEQCRERLGDVEETLRRAAQDEGPTILAAIREVEEILAQFSELIDPEVTARRNEQLARTQQRFEPQTLQPNRRVSRSGYTSLRQAVHTWQGPMRLLTVASGQYVTTLAGTIFNENFTMPTTRSLKQFITPT